MSVPRHTRTGAHRASRLAALRPRALRRTVRAVVGRAGAPSVPPAFVLLAAAAFVGGAVTSVTTHQLAAERARDATVAQAAHDQEARERADEASTERLSAQATAYLMARRDEARALAAGAVVSAGQVTTASAGLLDPSETAELDGAVAQLAVLLGEAPGSTVALDEALSTVVATPRRTTTPQAPPQPAPVAPLADVAALVEASRPSEPATATTQADPSAEDDAPHALAHRTRDVTALGTEVAREAAVRAPLDAAAVTTAAPVGATAAGAAAPTVAPVTSAAHELLATGTSRSLTPADGTEPVTSPVATLVAADAPPSAVLATADLGLTATTDLAAAAQHVLDLSAQVRTVVDQRIAEREAAARAAAEAAEAERRRLARETTSQRIKRLVAGAVAAPPGQIPAEFLCDVPFDHALRLRCDAAAALTLMDQAYRAESGKHLVIVSSYRTTDVQTQLYLEKGDIAAAPGTSNHERGQAIDVGGAGSLGQFDAPLYLWLKANAERFGWHHPAIMEPGGSGPFEPWHWEYGTKD